VPTAERERRVELDLTGRRAGGTEVETSFVGDLVDVRRWQGKKRRTGGAVCPSEQSVEDTPSLAAKIVLRVAWREGEVNEGEQGNKTTTSIP
jgi:hypothetical protein